MLAYFNLLGTKRLGCWMVRNRNVMNMSFYFASY
jgi:hypothetical protein